MSSPPAGRWPSRLVVTGLLVAGLALLAAAAWLALRPAPAAPATPATPAPPDLTVLPTPVSSTRRAPLATPAATEDTGSAPAAHLPVVLSGYDGGFVALGCDPSPDPGELAATLDGELAVWQPLTLGFAGPAAAASDTAPNPFLDYRLTVRFVAPSGHAYNVPGAFDGDGHGGGTGDRWSAHFAADEPGRWRWCASFRAGPGVAVALDPAAGAPLAFDGASGAFDIALLEAGSASEDADSTIVVTRASPPARPPTSEDADSTIVATRDFFTLGRLEYANGHYLKFRAGPYWIKTGTNSPENLLAYVGFDGAADTPPGFRHAYATHVADWRAGDPTLPGAADEGKGIIGALNYLAESGVNSVYFLPMNLGGDGNDTWPFLSPNDVTHYDLGKLAAWRVVFEHAQRRGIALHVVLSETEPANRGWLDGSPAVEGGSTAPGILSTPRRLFYRELVARFADLPAIKWNLGEESVYSGEEAIALAGYLAALDWAGHPIALHNPADWFGPYEDTLGRPEFSATSIQYQPDAVSYTHLTLPTSDLV